MFNTQKILKMYILNIRMFIKKKKKTVEINAQLESSDEKKHNVKFEIGWNITVCFCWNVQMYFFSELDISFTYSYNYVLRF